MTDIWQFRQNGGLPVSPTLPYLRVSKFALMRPGLPSCSPAYLVVGLERLLRVIVVASDGKIEGLKVVINYYDVSY